MRHLGETNLQIMSKDFELWPLSWDPGETNKVGVKLDGAKTNTLLKSCTIELSLKVLKRWWFGKEFWPALDILYIVQGVSEPSILVK